MKSRHTYQQKHMQKLLEENQHLKQENQRLRKTLDAQTEMVSELKNKVEDSQQQMREKLEELNRYRQDYQKLSRDMYTLKYDYSQKMKVLLGDFEKTMKRRCINADSDKYGATYKNVAK